MKRKHDQTGGEHRNQERVKALLREYVQGVINGQEIFLCEMLKMRTLFPMDYVGGVIGDTETRIGVLTWLLAMLRPNDPNTINQWNMSDGQQISAVAETAEGNSGDKPTNN